MDGLAILISVQSIKKKSRYQRNPERLNNGKGIDEK